MDAKRTAKDKVMSFLIECDSWPTGRTMVIEGYRVTFFEEQAEWQTGSESVDVIYKAEVDKCTLSQALKPVAHYATHTNESRSGFFAAIDGKPWLILSNGDYVKCTFELDDLIALPTAEHPVPKHYATPTDKIVEHALDATSNAPDEWKDGKVWKGWVRSIDGVNPENQGWEKVKYIASTKDGHIVERIDDEMLCWCSEFRPLETPAQAEEREREAVIYDISLVVSESHSGDAFEGRRIATEVYDWLKSTNKLKDKSDGE